MAEAAFLGDHECPVCHEDFTEPKLLPCTHRVCKKCVLSWLQSEGEGGCPLCRVPILSDACERVSATNCDITALVDNLPTDLATVALVESKTALSGQHVCGLCDVTGDSVLAASFCLDCSMKLCVSCVKAHQKIPATRQHVLEQLRTLTAERLASSRRSPCDSHTDRPAELYCPGHQTLICLLCATSKHRACSDVEGIADVAKKERATLKTQVERLRQKEAAITAEIAALEQEVVDTQKHFQTAKDDVVLTFGRLKEMLEKRCQEFITTLQSQEDKLVSGKKAEKPQLDQQRAAISTQARSLDQLLASSPDSALVGMLNKLKQRLASLERQPHTRKQQEGGLSKVKFDTQNMASLQREIAALGWVVNENLQKAAQRPWYSCRWCGRLGTQQFCPHCDERCDVLVMQGAEADCIVGRLVAPSHGTAVKAFLCSPGEIISVGKGQGHRGAGFVQVKWRNGRIKWHRMGANGVFDVELVD